MKEKFLRLLTAFDLKKFIKFGLIGVLNTLVDFGVFFVMNKLLGAGPEVTLFGSVVALGPYLSNTAAYVVANIHSFLWNKFWTFEKKDKLTRNEVIRYLCTSAGYLLISSVCLAIFMNVLSLSAFSGLPAGWIPMLAKLPTAVITIFYNYLMNRFWVFR